MPFPRISFVQLQGKMQVTHDSLMMCEEDEGDSILHVAVDNIVRIIGW